MTDATLDSTTDRTDAAGRADPPPTSVPPGEDPAVCGYCGRPLPDDDLLALHRGLAHYDALDDGERAAFEAAHDEETAEVRLFRLKALGALVALYFGFLFAYSVFG